MQHERHRGSGVFTTEPQDGEECVMPRGAYTAKQERKAEHIEKGYEKRGVSKKEAEERAWRTVNKQDKGGKNSGHGRSSSRSAAAKKGWETRRRHGKG
jgi:plasmid stabilization system protein ParE